MQKTSVIIPVYNNPKGLRDTLNSLVVQNYPLNDFEIIIADNGSTDTTLDIAKEFVQKYPKLIQLVLENNVQSSYAARNKGIKASKGSIIAFIDTDMSVEENWLFQIDTSLKKHRADYLAYRVKVYLKDKSIFGLYDKMFGFPVEEFIRILHFAPTNCLVVRRSVFEKLRLFDSRLVSYGDYEFGNRVFEFGYKLYYEPNIVVKHPALSSLKKLILRHFRTGRGSYQLPFYYQQYKRMHRNIFHPRYYLTIPWNLSNSMRRNKVWNEASFIIKTAFYFIYWILKLANHIGYIYESKRKKIKNKDCQRS